MRRVFRLAVLCALATCVACGSSYKGSSKVDFVAQADAVCKRYNGLSAQATSDLKNPTPAQQVAAIKTKIVPLFAREQAELRALKPPAADRKQVKQVLDALKAAGDDLSRNTEAFVTSGGASAYVARAGNLALGYGFKVCGVSASR
jgi:hypothetical protein